AAGSARCGPAAAGSTRSLLEEVLKCYEQPLNEEQAWALCFQSCRAAAAAAPPPAAAPLRTADIRLRGDGSVVLPAPPPGNRSHLPRCLAWSPRWALG
uniref:KIND domain-containing protein n=1 Tax=Calidris pygmaea TaxID=425635 RepID=A0A8C3PTF7_9CHAR